MAVLRIDMHFFFKIYVYFFETWLEKRLEWNVEQLLRAAGILELKYTVE